MRTSETSRLNPAAPRAFSAAAAALLFGCAGAFAETRPEAKPVPADAAQTFGDWTLRCGTSPSGERACEIAVAVIRPGQSGPIAQIAFGRSAPMKAPEKPAPGKAAEKGALAPEAAKPAAPLKLVLLVPVNVTIAPGVEVAPDAAQPPLKFPLKTCIQAACFAELELNAEQLQQFRGRTQPGQIAFVDPGGNPVKVTFSVTGLDQALDALARR